MTRELGNKEQRIGTLEMVNGQWIYGCGQQICGDDTGLQEARERFGN